MSGRSQFSGKMGFIIVTAGAAVGLGNIWRFPTVAAENGGGTFLLVYVLLLIVFGVPMFCTEVAIGRKTRESPLDAYPSLDRRGRFIGVLTTVIPAIVFPYYCVIGGWALGFFASYLIGLAPGGTGFFGDFAGSWWAVLATVLFLTVSSVVVYIGVKDGIERISRVFMPLFLILLVALVLYVIFQPGMTDGLAYFFRPDFSKIDTDMFVSALGQVFFSLSLAAGVLLTYGSYMNKDENIPRSAAGVVIIDTSVAVLAGMLVIPMAFKVFGTDIPSGPGLVFEALPTIFNGMPGGTVIAVVFFVLLFIAALTSAISMMEAVVSTVMERYGMERHRAVLVVAIPSVVIGTIISMGFGPLNWIQISGSCILDVFDFVASNLLMPIAAFCMCVFIGHVVGPRIIQDEIEHPDGFVISRAYPILIKWVLPALVALIVLFSFIS